jgi:hypothetical protein
MSVASVGYRTVLRHIFMTMSSRYTIISCVQYCTRHGLLVKVASGTRRTNAELRDDGMGGLQQRREEMNGVMWATVQRNDWRNTAIVQRNDRVMVMRGLEQKREDEDMV